MELSKLINLERENVTAEMLSKLEAMQWLEKFLREYGLAEVMEENATGFEAGQGTDYETLKDDLDWDDRRLYRRRHAPQNIVELFVPAEYKVLVQKALMRSSTDHGLDWEKRTALSWHTHPETKMPYMLETWRTKLQAENSWRQHEVEISFYWIPEIGEQIGDCTIELHDEHTAASTKQVVVQVCRKPSDG